MYPEEDYQFDYENSGSYLSQRKEKPATTIFGYVRGVSRLGIIFSSSLAVTLAGRLVPSIVPGCIILQVVAISGCMIAAFTSFKRDRLTPLLIVSLLIGGIAGGSWDGIQAGLSDRSGQNHAAQLGIGAAALCLVVAFDFWRRSDHNG